MKTLNISRFSALGFVLLLIILHFVNSDLDPTWQPISEYALGNMGWLMNIAFLLLGTSFFTLGFYLISNMKTLGVKIGGWLIILASLGNFLAGIFNTDPVSTLPEQMSTSGSIHAGAAGLLGFMILATPFVAYQFYSQENLNPYKNNLLWMTIILWIAELTLIGAMGYYLDETNGMITAETPIGWFGRVVVLLCALWTFVCAKGLQKTTIHHGNL